MTLQGFHFRGSFADLFSRLSLFLTSLLYHTFWGLSSTFLTFFKFFFLTSQGLSLSSLQANYTPRRWESQAFFTFFVLDFLGILVKLSDNSKRILKMSELSEYSENLLAAARCEQSKRGSRTREPQEREKVFSCFLLFLLFHSGHIVEEKFFVSL